jgi:hypothetical protein
LKPAEASLEEALLLKRLKDRDQSVGCLVCLSAEKRREKKKRF